MLESPLKEVSAKYTYPTEGTSDRKTSILLTSCLATIPRACFRIVWATFTLFGSHISTDTSQVTGESEGIAATASKVEMAFTSEREGLLDVLATRISLAYGALTFSSSVTSVGLPSLYRITGKKNLAKLCRDCPVLQCIWTSSAMCCSERSARITICLLLQQPQQRRLSSEMADSSSSTRSKVLSPQPRISQWSLAGTLLNLVRQSSNTSRIRSTTMPSSVRQ
mmetsp:Transcript_36535/g.85616  ORF Transcript_36535/g.85616 Transcript_36535/m.85616 type:complete len:223 (-) Transcript_36535:297-965(-)